jgi:hypothetical protein
MQFQEDLQGDRNMSQLTNVFRISGLNALSAYYRIADVIGLDKEQSDYFRSADRLMSLNRTLRRPVSVLELGGSPVIVYPDNTPIPTELDVGTRILSLRPRSESISIDFSRSTEFDPVRLRIVRFAIEEHLRAKSVMWQPSAGQAFFEREPTRQEGDIGLYSGTRVRPMVLPDGEIAVCIDKTSRLIALRSLPKHLNREAFEDRWKRQRCVYRYGDSWYEVRCQMLAGHTVSEYPVRQDNNGRTNLLKFLLDNVQKPAPKYVANLDPTGSVVIYRNARGEERAAPAELCFPVRDTEDLRRTALGRATIIEPQERMDWSKEFARRYLGEFKAGGLALHVSDQPISFTGRRFPIPDLQFGNNTRLTVNRSPNARQVRAEDLGSSRLKLLQEPGIGPLVARQLDRQYLILPQSAEASFGAAYAVDLQSAVNAIHPLGGYSPTIVTYDDTCRRTFVDQAKAIKAALARILFPGFAVVMIHRCKSGRRAEDALAAYVLRTFREQSDTIASVVHYDTAERLYETKQSTSGERCYKIRSEQRSRASGYFRNVAINKVLLTNQLWPFGLAQQLHADLTIGIDVKNNACCVLAVAGHGDRIASDVRISKQKEKLNSGQLRGYLYEIIGRLAQSATPIRDIVLHRDGRAYPSEILGARRAIEALVAVGQLPAGATLTVLEIHKSASVPLRIYGLDPKRGLLRKPTIGEVLITHENEAFVCTTGWPFQRPGTPNPLQLQRVYGGLSIEQCAQDVFALSNLTWTRPEDCSRYPVTLRLADRFLADEASVYDEDALVFGPSDDLKEETAHE